MRTERDGQELDAEDVHVGRAVITRGLVAPGDVLAALEETARARRKGRRIPLTDLLVRAGKISREALEPLRPVKGVPFSKSTIANVQLARHIPTMKLVDGWWRETRDSPARPPSHKAASSEVPIVLTEHEGTIDFAEVRAPEDESPVADVESRELESDDGDESLVIIDTLDPAAAAPPPRPQPPQPPVARRAPVPKPMAVVKATPPKPAPAKRVERVPTPPGGIPRVGAKMGPWVIESELGRGGMGIIFRARHESWGEVAAVKVLRDPTRKSLNDRFLRETESMRRLEHPNIVRILGQGREGYCPWFAMELVSGKTFAQLIREKQLLPRQAVQILRDVARAVHHAHELGVLHRDLKPANVLIANDGTVKVTDFGLAKLDDDERCLTRPGAPIGTPAFMSPEQAVGGAVDRRTDVFSLGVMLFEAVSGRLPWTPEHLAKLYAGGSVVLPPMKRGDARLEAIVLRATEGRAEGRFESAEAFAKELDAWLKGSVPSSSRLFRKLARLRSLPRSVELVAAASFGVFASFLASRPPAPAPRPEPVPATATPGMVAYSPPAPSAPVASTAAPAQEPVRTPAPPSTPAAATPGSGAGSAPVLPPRPAPLSPEPEPPKLAVRFELAPLTATLAPEPPRVEEPRSEPNEDPGVRRVKLGRVRLMRIVSSLPGVESFDEQALTLRMKTSAARVPLASLSPSFIASQLPLPEERANVAAYLRARSLHALAAAIEK